MDEYRPLSARAVPDDRYGVLREGLPGYFQEPIVAWLSQFLRSYSPMGEVHYDTEWTYGLQLRLQLDPPLTGVEHDEDSAAAGDLLRRIRADEEFALDVIDYALYSMVDSDQFWARDAAAELNAVLDRGHSVWEAVEVEGIWRLERRSVGPVRETVADVRSSSDRAGRHLEAARQKLAGRETDPTGAYREALRAVEAAAKPVVLPANNAATLGQMIAALRDKPEKWTTTLGEVDDVRRAMEIVWKGQLDRHGTDDESVPLNVSREQADAAFHHCLALTHAFVTGHIRAA